MVGLLVVGCGIRCLLRGAVQAGAWRCGGECAVWVGEVSINACVRACMHAWMDGWTDGLHGEVK